MRTDHRERWNERYRAQPDRFGVQPSPLLRELEQTLVPGEALELGCGEGRNCAFLAARGWRVTGIDFSDVAVDRARVNHSGLTFECADVTTLATPTVRYDLGCVVYLHTSPEERAVWFDGLIQAVRPGGHVIYVGHAPGEPPEPERPTRQTLVHDMLVEVGWTESAHDRDTEPGHRARADFGVIWRRR